MSASTKARLSTSGHKTLTLNASCVTAFTRPVTVGQNTRYWGYFDPR